MGLKKRRSRFGTTIANIGDINQDGFLDVAIGAPYEDGHGAIYIYHGGSRGLDENYKQRIAATDINPMLSGFGISISKGKDIDGNNYPDILVGSYASDNAVLFRTRPLVKVFGSIMFDPPQIDTNISRCAWNNNSVPCFNVTFCLLYKGNHLNRQIAISTKLTSSRQRDGLQARRYLMAGGKLTHYIRQTMKITKEEPRCYRKQVYVVGDSKDFITPIQMTLHLNLTHDVTKENSFCKSCPMLHPDFPSTINGTITFQTGCGDDGICSSDLNLTVTVSGLSSGELIIGQDNVIILSIELQNFNEPAYNTDVYLYIPSDVQIINQDSCENKQDFSDLPAIVCNAGNPLISGHVAKFEIKLDTSRVSTEVDYLAIGVKTTTASQEVNPEDNNLDIEIPLKIIADITIFGNSVVGQIILGKKHFEVGEPITIVHLYTVLKYLPGPVNSVAVEFLVPTSTIDEGVNFLRLNNIKINEGSSRASVPASCNFTIQEPSSSIYNLSTDMIPEDRTITPILTPRPKRSVDNGAGESVSSPASQQNHLPTNYVLGCNTSVCTRISCVAGPFKDTNLAANFRIYGTVNSTSLKTTLDQWDKIAIVTEGMVKIRDKRENIQPLNHRPDEIKVVTTIQYSSLPPTHKIEIWLIISSIAAGILLLILISLVLIKMGFFQRKEKQYMKNVMMRAELERLDPHVAAETNTIHSKNVEAS